MPRQTSGADGAWGPLELEGAKATKFEVAAPGALITHVYRSPFPRSLAILNLRPAPALTAEERSAGAVVMMSQPRGYFGFTHDYVRIDGRRPEGVPAIWTARLKLDAVEDRPTVAEFNEERIVARPWPGKYNHISIAEMCF